MVCRYIGVEPRPGSYRGSEVLSYCQGPFRTTFAGGCICTIARDGFHRAEAVHDIFMMGFSYDDPFILSFITDQCSRSTKFRMTIVTNKELLEQSQHVKEFFRTLSLHSRNLTCYAYQGESKRPTYKFAGKSDWIQRDYSANMHAKSLRIGPILIAGSSNWTVSGAADYDVNAVTWLGPAALREQHDRETDVIASCVPVASVISFGAP